MVHSVFTSEGFIWIGEYCLLSLVNMSMKYEPIMKASKVVGVTLTIMFDPKPQPSASGKTLIDFSTRGNQKIDVGGKAVTVGLNIYHKP